ncbi:MAG: hypothetical protein ACR2J6_00805 [Thermoleophilaceae bacterium]
MLRLVRKVLLGVIATLLVLVIALQRIVPSVIEGQVEKRLEQGGGDAKVSISAVPAVTLLRGVGRSIDITGSGLTYDLGQRDEKPFERLDGFGRVKVDLRDLDAGPVRLDSFVLTRADKDEPYTLSMRGTSTPGELAGELGTATGGSLGGLIGGLASGILGGSGTSVPLRLEATVASRDGRPEVGAANATVAGLPAGPLTEIVLRSVLDRL